MPGFFVFGLLDISVYGIVFHRIHVLVQSPAQPSLPALSPKALASEQSVPKILVFDSGLGGLTVFSQLRALCPQANYFYVADDAAFPYGRHAPHIVIERVMAVIAGTVAAFAPDLVVIACNTASTLVLGPLRSAWPKMPFVGTVPAVKPAAAQTKSGMFSVLATPGTVARDYTHELVREFAGGCDVELVGSKRLASLAEAFMQGEAVDDSDIWAEIAPCFVAEGDRRTDVVVMACTHYPLLLDAFKRLAPWPVTWIDSGPAIAKRAQTILNEFQFALAENELSGEPSAAGAVFTLTSGAQPSPNLWAALEAYGFTGTGDLKVPFHSQP